MRLEAEIGLTNVPEHTEGWFITDTPSQAGVHFINRLPNSMKNAQRPRASKTRLKRFLVSNAFYSVDGLLAFNWETTQFDDLTPALERSWHTDRRPLLMGSHIGVLLTMTAVNHSRIDLLVNVVTCFSRTSRLVKS
ncbi:hypothetical protein J6590_065526 [Homalodisca vitripennis]|nr:hypothetical protein J6590_065526 [Homalodisca vitripennis]